MLHIGDKLVQSDGTIFGIVDVYLDNFNNSQTYFYKLKPIFESQNNLEVTYPIESLGLLNHKSPVDCKELDIILNYLSHKADSLIHLPKTQALKEELKSNESKKIAAVLKILYLNNKETGLSFTQKQLLNKAFKRLSKETAVVKNITTDEADKLIINSLEKSLS